MKVHIEFLDQFNHYRHFSTMNHLPSARRVAENRAKNTKKRHRIIDENGGMINDPLIYKLKDDLWRVCIADSDVLLFAKGIAAGKNLNVKIFEANICLLYTSPSPRDS